MIALSCYVQSYLLNIPSWNTKCGDDVVCMSEVQCYFAFFVFPAHCIRSTCFEIATGKDNVILSYPNEPINYPMINRMLVLNKLSGQ